MFMLGDPKAVPDYFWYTVYLKCGTSGQSVFIEGQKRSKSEALEFAMIDSLGTGEYLIYVVPRSAVNS
jgi:hypothetical protein